MTSMFKKAMLYLGLGSDEDFEKFDRQVSGDDYDRVRALDQRGAEVDVDPPPNVPAGPINPDEEPRRAAVSAVRPIPADEVPEAVRRPSVVRPIPAPATAKPVVLKPTSFNDAQEVADTFKKKQPVIINLQHADRDLTRRLIDFASGLCYGVGGDMNKVAQQVYLITPADIEISEAERQILRDDGLHD
jgi:cell division inhibitor SepF